MPGGQHPSAHNGYRKGHPRWRTDQGARGGGGQWSGVAADGWIRALKSAEASAKTARLPVRLYQANYPVKEHTSETKGDYDQRRDALVAMFRSLTPKERHPGTSTWIFQLHIADATTVANLLTPPLDTAVDFLAVAELTANRTTVGNAKLKS